MVTLMMQCKIEICRSVQQVVFITNFQHGMNHEFCKKWVFVTMIYIH